MTASDLKHALKLLGLTQAQLAEKLGVDLATVSRWANGHLPVPQYAVSYVELAMKDRQQDAATTNQEEIMKRYFACQSNHGSSTSHGFCNDWTVYVFSSKKARDKFVDESDNLSCIAIPLCEVTKHARNYSLTRNEYSEQKPFSGEFWAVMPSYDADENPIDRCIGIVDVCDVQVAGNIAG